MSPSSLLLNMIPEPCFPPLRAHNNSDFLPKKPWRTPLTEVMKTISKPQN